ncbi:hypothetical protein HRI_003800200 [Hibiscus trionum]|uniref:Aspartic peptidase DDI1-type domain-containing protein n=1 Tax=Hibiscus trionum TaxID=183268 RepID=A0A9W7IRF7_HIBTR|nr:hypothetical protein HRI_003800200 [Hibiscus trionum]
MKSDCPMNDRLNVVQGDEIEESEEEVMRLGVIASVNKSRESPGATISVKVAESRSKPGGISDDKAVKPRVEKMQMECHRCKGSHRVHACPHRVKPSKVVDNPEQSDATRLGSMILNSAKVKGRKQKRLIFVDINVARRPQNAPVDTGATNLFMSKKAVEKLGLRVESSTGKIKIENTKEVLIVGEARKVELQIGEWKGEENFKVIHLDDFDFILGLNFLNHINAFIVPCVDAVCIFYSKQQCVVPTYRDEGK